MIRTLVYLLPALALLGMLAPPMTRRLGHIYGVILSAIPLLMMVLFLSFNTTLGDTQSVVYATPWQLVPGAPLSFRIDGLSLIFGVMVSGIGFLVLNYAAGYMKGHAHIGRFLMLMTLFMVSMLGLVLSENLITLFFFWELTSVISFLLIGFDNHLEKARKAALQALLITAAGGLSLLFAFLLMGNIAGTYTISELLDKGPLITHHHHYPLIFILLAIAVFTKSAQFPFHFWLPGAMNAPTPVSAYLHSATMVNAGVFLMLRVMPFAGDTMLWKTVFPIVGSVTMFVGAFLSFGERDLKRILAFTTISALGTMVLMAGLGTNAATKATLVFFVVHGLYKGALFMITGIIDKSTGTRDLMQLRQLWKPLRSVSGATFITLFSMAGLPPMLGFIGKELIYGAKLQSGFFPEVMLMLGIGTNALMVAISILIAYRLFWSRKAEVAPPPFKDKYPRLMLLWMGPVVLSAVSLLLGLTPNRIARYLNNAIYHIRAIEYDAHLTLWHGFNAELLLSIATVTLGVVIFIYRETVTRFITRINGVINRYYLPDLFDKLIKGYVKVAARQTNRIQHGYHRYYLMTFFLIATGAMAVVLFPFEFETWMTSASPVKTHIVILLAVMSLGMIYAMVSPSRLSAILALGIVGYGIGLLYLFFGAVDLAITQFLVETLIMVLFILVIDYLPAFASLSVRRSRRRDAIIATVVGVFVTIVVLEARFVNVVPPISQFFIDHSLLKAFGHNIVNVILVDFRAMDTLGEITVLALAASGVVALVNVGQKCQSGQSPMRIPPADTQSLRTLIIAGVVTWIRRVLIVVAVWLLLRGHNAPGGGFIGGIIAASGYVFYAIIFGSEPTRKKLRIPPFIIIGIGLGLSMLAGVLPMFMGEAMLTAQWLHLTLPMAGELHLGTPLLFDTGVMLVVFGMINAIVLTIMNVLKWN
ncbi:multicomponent Na+:H+ antiporter subunit A [Breznakibacter xylanolyticus]|uniref:Multicomponent Na+:H+ antiporter subunit A n=1 Tax=Breznakibacter xylanolyticus TaxID=990 RepID=A0A2W7Q694_9BACT|nr:hydrogen gas-evolving membrane-bound hydrogenase subunit E [Breznakibacter xylanolyticus]PZX17259.1 multicomponent Na+:H+ antiporter subunit A [Breznakibacter xylanolyticus]